MDAWESTEAIASDWVFASPATVRVQDAKSKVSSEVRTMFQPWRLKLREADEALQGGRLEEAGRLLCQSELREFLPSKQLLAKVAGRMVERAEDRVAGGQSSAGWRDLETARLWGANPEAVSTLRQAFISRRVAEAEASLAAGEPAAAVSRLDDLSRHGDV